MSRAKRGFKARRRRNKVFKLAKGFTFDRRTTFRQTVQTVQRALHYAFKNRRRLKREMRSLWIQRISAAAKHFDTSYSRLIGALKAKGIEINRKMLADIAYHDLNGFKAIVDSTK
jgi:large subunit ribosomal protein L20